MILQTRFVIIFAFLDAYPNIKFKEKRNFRQFITFLCTKVIFLMYLCGQLIKMYML